MRRKSGGWPHGRSTRSVPMQFFSANAIDEAADDIAGRPSREILHIIEELRQKRKGMVQLAAGVRVVRISRRVILLEVCKELALHPPEFIFRDSTGDGAFIAEATAWYCPAAAGGPPLNRKINGSSQATTREEAVEQVAEEAINFPAAQMLKFHQECVKADCRRLMDEMNEAVEMVDKFEAGCFETVRALMEYKELLTSGAVLYKDCDVTKGLPEFAGSDFNMEGARKVLEHVAECLEICCESASKRVGPLH